MPTIQDVATYCGVSKATISRVLNNRPGRVSPEARERILQAIRDLNYRPVRGHRDASAPLSITLGIAGGMPGSELLHSGYHRSVVNSILASIANSRQMALMFHDYLWTGDPTANIRRYCDGRCEGIILIAPPLDLPLISRLQERGFPFVLVNYYDSTGQLPFCDIDNLSATTAVVNELIRHGHRRIGYVSGPSDSSASLEREKAFRMVLAEAGISLDEQLVSPPTERYGEEKGWLSWVLSLPSGKRPTALFCFTDRNAETAIGVAAAKRIHVPSELSIVGFDDLEPTSTELGLTTIRQPYQEITNQALAIVLAQITGATGVKQQVTVQGELIVRSSVGPVPA